MISEQHSYPYTLVPEKLKHVRNLVFRGGGPKGGVYTGAYAALEGYAIMPQIENVAGSSAGAMTAIAIALGASPEQFKEFIFNQDIAALCDKTTSQINDGNYGFKVTGNSLYEGFVLYDFIRNMIRNLVGDRLRDVVENYGTIGDASRLLKQKLQDKVDKINLKIAENENSLSELEQKYESKSSTASVQGQSSHSLFVRLLEIDKENQVLKSNFELSVLKQSLLTKRTRLNIKLINAISDLNLYHKFIELVLNINKREFKIDFSHIQALRVLLPEKVKSIYITGTAYETNDIDIFCYKNFKNMEVALAGRISAALPIMFKAVAYNGKVYIDGGAADNFPVIIFLKQNTRPGVLTTIGFVPQNTKYNPEEAQSYFNMVEESALYYTYGLDNSDYKNEVQVRIAQAIKNGELHVISLPVGNVGTFSFDITERDKADMYGAGFGECLNTLQTLVSPEFKDEIEAKKAALMPQEQNDDMDEYINEYIQATALAMI